MLKPTQQQQREEVFVGLYKKAYPIVARYVAKMGGTYAQAQDVFQDTLIIYYEKVLSNSLILKTSEKAYLLGIAKHLWIKTYNASADQVSLDGDFDVDPLVEAAEVYATGKLIHYLETAGQKCMDMLRAFYYDKLPVTQIAETFGYSGVRSATVQKFKCLEKVRDTIKTKSLSYEDFLE